MLTRVISKHFYSQIATTVALRGFNSISELIDYLNGIGNNKFIYSNKSINYRDHYVQQSKPNIDYTKQKYYQHSNTSNRNDHYKKARDTPYQNQVQNVSTNGPRIYSNKNINRNDPFAAPPPTLYNKELNQFQVTSDPQITVTES